MLLQCASIWAEKCNHRGSICTAPALCRHHVCTVRAPHAVAAGVCTKTRPKGLRPQARKMLSLVGVCGRDCPRKTRRVGGLLAQPQCMHRARAIPHTVPASTWAERL